MRGSSIGMLLIVFGAASACSDANGLGAMPVAPTPPSHVVTIDVAEVNGPYSFFPSPAMVATGQTVVWMNSDTVTHHVVFDENAAMDTGALAPGTTSQPMAIGAGTWNYHCSIHPTMVGTLTVTPS
jgi:plastocyanin